MIGAVAHKYYMLFQQHLPPITLGTAHDSNHAMTEIPKPEYILGRTPGVRFEIFLQRVSYTGPILIIVFSRISRLPPTVLSPG
jgi:hypothetical protein